MPALGYWYILIFFKKPVLALLYHTLIYHNACKRLRDQGLVYFPAGNDRPFPESRYWTGWTNDQKPGKEFAFQECEMGRYVTQMRWHQFQHGFCDVQIKCSGMDWSPAVTGCEHYTKGKHFWTKVRMKLMSTNSVAK